MHVGIISYELKACWEGLKLVYSGGYASICDSSSSGYWYADVRGWGAASRAEAVS